MKTCPHEGAPAPHEVAFYLVQSAIKFPRADLRSPTRRTRALSRPRRVRRMVGCNGMPASSAAD